MLDEVSNDELLEFSNLIAHEPKSQSLAQKKQSRSNLVSIVVQSNLAYPNLLGLWIITDTA